MYSLEKNTDEIIQLMLFILRKIRPHQIGKLLGLGRADIQAVRVLCSIDGCDLTEMASALSVSQPTASITVDRLVKSGIVERTSNPSDRRVTHINLTERGKRIAGEIIEAYRLQMLGYVERLSNSERENLIGLLQKIVSG